MDNPIIAEIRARRLEMLNTYNGDMDAMMRDMMKSQFERGHNVVSFQPKKSVESSDNYLYHSPKEPK